MKRGGIKAKKWLVKKKKLELRGNYEQRKENEKR